MARFTTLAIVLALCAGALPGQLSTDHVSFYVDANVPGPGTGTFFDPFKTIAQAMAASVPHDYVIVLPGVYHETLDMPPFLYVRAPQGPLVTTIDATGLPGDFAVNVSTLSELRGFTVRKADGGGVRVLVPGGAKGTPEFGRIIKQNRILDCPQGGLLLDGLSNPIVADNVIAGCGAFGVRLVEGPTPWFSTNTITGNASGLEVIGSASPGNPVFANNIIWGNTVEVVGLPAAMLSHCDVGDPTFAGLNGNFSQDPDFVALTTHDYRLAPGSPCIDAGNDAQVSFQSVFDNRGYGSIRRADGDHDGVITVDVGAIERGGLHSASSGVGVGGLIAIEIDTGPGTDWQLAVGLFNQNPLFAIPGANGLLYLEPAFMTPIAGGTQGASGRTLLTYLINDPILLDVKIPLQALGVDYSGASPVWTFTNAELLHIR